MMRARLGDASRVSRSESPDTQLGESLLDPPNSLSRIPRRFQSPSRSGSPSLETPEHIICRIRQPGPTPGRPPDIAAFCQPLVVPARQPLNTFAWTQTRYPTPQPQQVYPPPSHYQHHPHHHPEIFHPVPSESLNLDHCPSPHRSYSSFCHHPLAPPPPPPQVFFGSGSPLLWQQNIPSRDKGPGPFAHNQHFSLVQHQRTQHLQEFLHPWENQTHRDGPQNFTMTGAGAESQLGIGDSTLHQLGEMHFVKDLPASGGGQGYSMPCSSGLLSSEGLGDGKPSAALSLATDAGDQSASSLEKIGLPKFTISPTLSPSKSREPQGMKRKGAYTKESPRTKRESPPHVYYSKESKELELKREGSQGSDEELRKRKIDGREGETEESESNTGKKSSASSSSSKRALNQLWPSCSQQGKHLCSSIQDLNDMTFEEHADFLPNIKVKAFDNFVCLRMKEECLEMVTSRGTVTLGS